MNIKIISVALLSLILQVTDASGGVTTGSYVRNKDALKSFSNWVSAVWSYWKGSYKPYSAPLQSAEDKRVAQLNAESDALAVQDIKSGLVSSISSINAAALNRYLIKALARKQSDKDNFSSALESLAPVQANAITGKEYVNSLTVCALSGLSIGLLGNATQKAKFKKLLEDFVGDPRFSVISQAESGDRLTPPFSRLAALINRAYNHLGGQDYLVPLKWTIKDPVVAYLTNKGLLSLK